MPAEMRQCTNPSCRLRFPAEAGLAKAHVCPFCSAPTQLAAAIEPYSQHNPRMDRQAGPRLAGFLDNLRSCFNVGSIFRSADGAGLEQLYLAGTTPTPQHPKVAKTALGSEDTIDWIYRRNGLDLAEELVASGHQLWSLEVSPAALSIHDSHQPDPTTPVVLVVGNEVFGIDSAILALSSRHIWIPMQGFKRSLNVAIAFSIAAYHLRFAMR